MKNRKLFGLQLFAEAVAGKKIVYLYRILSTEKDHDAKALAFTTENERTKSKDADTTATKDGTVRTPGTAEVEITASSLLKKGDKFIDELEAALDDDEKMEIWEVNLAEPQASSSNKFKAKYFAICSSYSFKISFTAFLVAFAFDKKSFVFSMSSSMSTSSESM